MADYFFVQYEPVLGGWRSPAPMEECWEHGCILQCRFDNASGVALVKCKDGSCTGHGTLVADPTTEIRAWLTGIERIPGAEEETFLTVDEEEAMIKRLAMGWS